MWVIAMSSDHEQNLVTQWLRSVDPARTPVDAEPPARLFALGERLKAEQLVRDRARTRRRGVRVAWAVSLASLVVVAAIAVSSVLMMPAAQASTPTPLTFHSPAAEHQIIADAVKKLAAQDGVAAPERSVREVSWAISIEDGKISGPVVPQIVELDWNADLSGVSTIIKGRTEDPVDGHVGRVVPTDEEISKQKFATGEFGVPSPDSPPATVAGVSEMLTMFGMPEHPTAGQLVESMVTVMDYWTLSDAQQAVLLEMIGQTGEGRSLGRSVDRLGRDVEGLRIDSATSGLTHAVLISAETGRIVGVETQRTTAEEGIPADTVVEYRMWDPERGEAG